MLGSDHPISFSRLTLHPGIPVHISDGRNPTFVWQSPGRFGLVNPVGEVAEEGTGVGVVLAADSFQPLVVMGGFVIREECPGHLVGFGVVGLSLLVDRSEVAVYLVDGETVPTWVLGSLVVDSHSWPGGSGLSSSGSYSNQVSEVILRDW